MRREYWTTIGEVKLADLVFIDETGVNLAMTRHFARATKGKRAYGKCPYNRGKNVTLIGAIATSGFLAPFTFEGWTNQIKRLFWFILKRYYYQNSGQVLVWLWIIYRLTKRQKSKN